MNKKTLIERLRKADPGWPVWELLLDFVADEEFALEEDEQLGDSLSSDVISFKALPDGKTPPDFCPAYVTALFGMNDDPELAGGYAEILPYRELAQRGALFSMAGNDADAGYPVFDPPADMYYFQTNDSGGVIFLNSDLDVLCPTADPPGFAVLDSLGAFTQVFLQAFLHGEDWFDTYAEIAKDLID